MHRRLGRGVVAPRQRSRTRRRPHPQPLQRRSRTRRRPHPQPLQRHERLCDRKGADQGRRDRKAGLSRYTAISVYGPNGGDRKRDRRRCRTRRVYPIVRNLSPTSSSRSLRPLFERTRRGSSRRSRLRLSCGRRLCPLAPLCRRRRAYTAPFRAVRSGSCSR